MRTRVIVLAGPSGSGKSRLARRLRLPVLNLDDFYKDGDDPTLPRMGLGHDSLVDWDDPASWHLEAALEAIGSLCREGRAEVPVYDIAHDGRTGVHVLDLGGAPHFVAEGIFAQEVVAGCRERDLLAGAVCVRNHPLRTFWRRLRRDLREHRKPPGVLLRRGLRLLRREPEVVAHAAALGCEPMTPEEAFAHLRHLGGPQAGAHARGLLRRYSR